jgi:hypothetical protein
MITACRKDTLVTSSDSSPREPGSTVPATQPAVDPVPSTPYRSLLRQVRVWQSNLHRAEKLTPRSCGEEGDGGPWPPTGGQ